MSLFENTGKYSFNKRKIYEISKWFAKSFTESFWTILLVCFGVLLLHCFWLILFLVLFFLLLLDLWIEYFLLEFLKKYVCCYCFNCFSNIPKVFFENISWCLLKMFIMLSLVIVLVFCFYICNFLYSTLGFMKIWFVIFKKTFDNVETYLALIFYQVDFIIFFPAGMLFSCTFSVECLFIF